jgi:excinuclease ABC subunit B
VKRLAQASLHTYDGSGERDEATVAEAIDDVAAVIAELEDEMQEAAGRLEFERAARLRDEIERVKTAERVEDVLREPGEEPRPAPGMPGTKARKRRKLDHFKKKRGG